ncbi:MAG: site-2 protease family protein [Candidatus Saccharimonas sp.]
MDIGYIVVVLGVIFFSMTLHEVMHGLVAYRLGDETARLLGRLTLNPIKHIDPFLTILLPLMIVITNMTTGAAAPIFGGAKPVPFNPSRIKYDEWGVAIMALAGPLTNFVIAGIAYGIMALGGFSSQSLAGGILSVTVVVNLGFFVFNILPLPLLDGSRVMYALAPDFVRRTMDVIERYGIFLVFAIVMLFGELLHAYIVGMIQLCIRLFAMIFGVVSL